MRSIPFSTILIFLATSASAVPFPVQPAPQTQSIHKAQAREIYGGERRAQRDDRRNNYVEEDRPRNGSTRLSTDQMRSINDAILQQRILTSPALRQ